MSRFSGPQNRGASRQLHAQRRTEAEARQAEERARDAARAAAYVEPPSLTDPELAELLLAALRTGSAPSILYALQMKDRT